MQQKKIGGFKAKQVAQTYEGLDLESSERVKTFSFISNKKFQKKQTRELEQKLSLIWEKYENEYNRILLAKDKKAIQLFKNKMTELFMKENIEVRYINDIFPGK